MNNEPLLKILFELSRIDAALARINADRKKLEKDIFAKCAALDKSIRERQQARALQDKEEASVTAARADFVAEKKSIEERRQRLSTLGNAKLQQAAVREIEHAERELVKKERLLLAREEVLLQDPKIETPEADLRGALVAAEEEARLTEENLLDREKRLTVERVGFASKMDAANLAVYERIKERYPMDPAIKVHEGRCDGCGQQVVPQMMLHLEQGQSLVKCRGCGRILFLLSAET